MKQRRENSTLIKGLGVMSRLSVAAAMQPLQLAGLAKRGETTLTETMESDGSHNTRLDLIPPEPVSVSLFVHGFASVRRLFDPSDAEGFLAWYFDEGTHITISGLAHRAPCENGRLWIEPPKALRYYYEFTGDDGVEYCYRGAKNLLDWNPVRGWTTLYGGVYERDTDKQVVKSTTAFGKGDLMRKLPAFFWSMKLR